MLVFLDESGDPGRKIDKGSSPFFVVALVTFDDHDEADKCDQRITALRSELKLGEGYEFHFGKNSKRVRSAFLEAVHPHHFFYHAFALNKDPKKLYGRGFDFKESLYKWVASTTFQNAKSYLDDATVVLDQCGDRKFRDELAAYLRARINSKGGKQAIKKVKIQRSTGNNLIQLADYVASITHRHVAGTPGGSELRSEFLASHESSFRLWPK